MYSGTPLMVEKNFFFNMFQGKNSGLADLSYQGLDTDTESLFNP